MPPIHVNDEKHETSGLHVVSIEFPPPPPRYSRLRVPTWFRSSGRQRSDVPPLPEIGSANQTSSQQRGVSANPQSGSETTIVRALDTASTRQGDENQDDIEKTVILDRRWLGWTWRRWVFVLGPCLAIVVMAIVLVVVFVTRGNGDSSSTTTSSASQTTATVPSSAATNIPVPSGSVPSTSAGAFNGTSIASAVPGNGQDAVWVFYQDSSGDLCYIPLEKSGTWGRPIKLTAPDGVLNGTAITALNWPSSSPTHINLIYQNTDGNLRNFLYSNTTGKFTLGYIAPYNIALPTDPNLIKRISWYSDDSYYHFIYFAGPDGLIREYTYNMTANTWTPSFTFPKSNGYASSAVLYDTTHNTTTMHLINTANQLQIYWRNYSNITNTNLPPTWTAGATIPNSKTPLGFNLNVNSSLGLTQFAGQAVFAQDRVTNAMWQVGWSGQRDKQAWTQGVPLNVSLVRDSDMYVERVSLASASKQVEYAFAQQSGDDITLLTKGSSGFQYAGRPVGG